MEIDIPEAKAELEEAFRRYEAALTANDVAVLDELFKVAPYTVRYGATEVLHGYAEIAAFRASRPGHGLARTLIKTVITTFGRDFGTASTTFRRDGGTQLGRQMQTWVRFPGEGWRVVAAHVSLMDEAKG
jgi:hypothetical protein